jgi:anti-sigma regulatory factor (Ser/Thr protein kinase)
VPELAQLVVAPIEIRVPAVAELSRVLRLAASGVASLAQRTVDDIEDIKIAVSEVFLALIEHGAGAPIVVTLSFADETFLITGRTEVVSFDIDHPDLVLCRTVLAGVCADHTINLADGYAEIVAIVAGGADG